MIEEIFDKLNEEAAPLKLFSSTWDMIIAKDEASARQMLDEYSESEDEDDDTYFQELDPSQPLERTNPDTGETRTMTGHEWIKQYGEGYLWSTEHTTKADEPDWTPQSEWGGHN